MPRFALWLRSNGLTSQYSNQLTRRSESVRFWRCTSWIRSGSSPKGTYVSSRTSKPSARMRFL